MTQNWDFQQSAKLYNLNRWGYGYFKLNQAGELEVHPNPEDLNNKINLPKLAKELEAKEIPYPILLRFPDILQDRLKNISSAFENAIKEQNYDGAYTPIYPIKVNQQKSVVEALLQTPNTRLGLEAGSKPELLAILALSNQKPTYMVCNGYKDAEFIQLAFLGTKLGHKLFIVIEKLAELDLVIKESNRLNIKPLLGVRVRLDSVSKGNWQNSGGEKSKFGLTATQVLTMVEKLKSHQMLDSLQLLHFHLGSQIADIEDLQQGLIESSVFYKEVLNLGANLNFIDVGGGLGIDYTGTRSRQEFSLNYTLAEYANTIISTFKEASKKFSIKMPNIFSESGRAISAHHAIMLTNIADIEAGFNEDRINSARAILANLSDFSNNLNNSDNLNNSNNSNKQGDEKVSEFLQIKDTLQKIDAGRDESEIIESYHQISKQLNQAQTRFKLGDLDLSSKAKLEELCFLGLWKIKSNLDLEYKSHRDISEELETRFASKLFVNFSLFQSLPDVWGLGQIFPIMPIKGLALKPESKGIIQDITCDSDGRVDFYIKGQDLQDSLTLPYFDLAQKPLLAFFLVGAYQEILGDMHNLFGSTYSLNVRLKNGEVEISDIKSGASVAEVLQRVNYDAELLSKNLQTQIEKQLQSETALNLDTNPKAENTAKQEAQREQNKQEAQNTQSAQLEFWQKLVTEGIDGYTYLEE